MKKRWVILILVAAAAGALLSLYTAYDYYHLINNAKDAPSYCNINELINCDAVTLSPSSRFLGQPNGFYGVIYFTLLFLLALTLLTAGDEYREEARELLFGATLIGALASLFFFGLSLLVIHALCLNCIGIYLLTGLCLWGGRKISQTSWLMALPQMAFSALRLLSAPGRSIANRVYTFLGLALLFSASLNYWLLIQRWSSVGRPVDKAKTEQLMQLARQEIAAGESPTWGAAQPQLTIVEFSDFRCPYCQKGAQTAKGVLYSYRDRVRLVFKHFPLDMECNPLLNYRLHDGACQAAYASLCADEQGQFWPYHDRLFRDNKVLNREMLRMQAKALGLDIKKFNDCLDSPRPPKRVAEDIQQAVALGLNSTPVFFFDGRRYQGALSGGEMQSIISRFLEQKIHK